MLKKTITYTDFNDVERTEDFHFNLTEAELTEMEVSVEGGLAEMIKKVVEANDIKTVIAIFKDLILKAYGIKDTEGKRFIKSKELSEAFSQTNAYSVLFMELATDAEKGAAFVNGIVPANRAPQTKQLNG